MLQCEPIGAIQRLAQRAIFDHGAHRGAVPVAAQERIDAVEILDADAAVVARPLLAIVVGGPHQGRARRQDIQLGADLSLPGHVQVRRHVLPAGDRLEGSPMVVCQARKQRLVVQRLFEPGGNAGPVAQDVLHVAEAFLQLLDVGGRDDE